MKKNNFSMYKKKFSKNFYCFQKDFQFIFQIKKIEKKPILFKKRFFFIYF
jgi:hypothetical protein